MRKESLHPYAEDAQEKALGPAARDRSARRRPADAPPEIQKKLRTAATKDVQELLPHLLARCEQLAKRAREKLDERGEREAKEMVAILEGQRVRIERELAKTRDPQLPLAFKDWRTTSGVSSRTNMQYWEQRLARLAGEVVQRARAHPRKLPR